MNLTNPNEWRVDDNYSNLEIGEIYPTSEKLHSLWARVEDRSLLSLSTENICGIVFMAKELEYHFGNFQRLQSQFVFPGGLRSIEQNVLIEEAKFEAFAYISTVGRIYYWVTQMELIALAPKILEVTESFRNKYVAHRSSDKTKKETEVERELHHYLTLGNLFNAKGELILQIQKTEGESVEFNLPQDHQIVMSEFLEVFTRIIQKS